MERTHQKNLLRPSNEVNLQQLCNRTHPQHKAKRIKRQAEIISSVVAPGKLCIFTDLLLAIIHPWRFSNIESPATMFLGFLSCLVVSAFRASSLLSSALFVPWDFITLRSCKSCTSLSFKSVNFSKSSTRPQI